MLIGFWLLAVAAVLLALGQLMAALQLRGAYRLLETSAVQERPPVHLTLQLQEPRAAGGERWVEALRPPAASFPGDPLTLWIASSDPAVLQRASALQREAQSRGLRATLHQADPSEGLAGAIAAALAEEGAAILAFAEGDTMGSAALLDEGVRSSQGAAVSGGANPPGAAFALDVAAVAAGVGGALIAAAQNALITPTYAGVARLGNPRFVATGLWVAPRAAVALALPALRQASGSEPLGALLGATLARAGRRNRALRRALPRHTAATNTTDALRRIGDRLAELPVFGARRALLLLSWGALPLMLAALLLGLSAAPLEPAVAVALLGTTVALRAAATLSLQRTFKPPGGGWAALAGTLLLEGALWPAALLAARRARGAEQSLSQRGSEASG